MNEAYLVSQQKIYEKYYNYNVYYLAEYEDVANDGFNVESGVPKGIILRTINSSNDEMKCYIAWNGKWREIPEQGGGGGAVASVNGKIGVVVLKAEDINCDSGNTIENEIQQAKDNTYYFQTPDGEFFRGIGSSAAHIPDFTVKQVRDAYDAFIAGKRVILITNKESTLGDKLEIVISSAKTFHYRDSTTSVIHSYKQIQFMADFANSTGSVKSENSCIIELLAEETALDTDIAEVVAQKLR